MKKIIILLMAVAMMSTLAIPAYAGDISSSNSTIVTVNYQGNDSDDDDDDPINPSPTPEPTPDNPEPAEPDPIDTEPTDSEPASPVPSDEDHDIEVSPMPSKVITVIKEYTEYITQPKVVKIETPSSSSNIEPGTINDGYTMTVPSTMTMNTLVKNSDGTLCLFDDNTIKCEGYIDKDNLVESSINKVVSVSVESSNNFKVADRNNNEYQYELDFGSIGKGIDVNNEQSNVCIFTPDAIEIGSSIVVNSSTVDYDIFSNTKVNAGDTLTWCYATKY